MRYRAARWYMGPVLAAVSVSFVFGIGIGAASATSIAAGAKKRCPHVVRPTGTAPSGRFRTSPSNRQITEFSGRTQRKGEAG